MIIIFLKTMSEDFEVHSFTPEKYPRIGSDKIYDDGMRLSLKITIKNLSVARNGLTKIG
jgi:hypothetical protein